MSYLKPWSSSIYVYIYIYIYIFILFLNIDGFLLILFFVFLGGEKILAPIGTPSPPPASAKVSCQGASTLGKNTLLTILYDFGERSKQKPLMNHLETNTHLILGDGWNKYLYTYIYMYVYIYIYIYTYICMYIFTKL